MVESVLQLKCSCNEYPWGRQGSQSLAARLAAKTPGTDFKIDESKSYSEMWMGTYPELPSYVLETGEDLQQVIDKYPTELIGKRVLDKFNNANLPFLPKVLSIAKALPLQIHPDKDLSAKLHEKDPSNFTDPNHKPEIGLALTKFESFVGFKPAEQLESLFKLEPLQQFMPQIKKPKLDDMVLKHVVFEMLSASDETVKKVEEELAKIPRERYEGQEYILDLLPRLQKQYTDTDPGTLVALLTMNYMVLAPGEAIYIPADGIHAYLSGDIIECMARSNNVLNTGFCPRAERNNVEMFVNALTFTPHTPKEALLASKPFEGSKNGKTVLYAPPMSEFNMLAIKLGVKEKEEIRALGGPSVFVVTSGDGKMSAGGKEFELKEGYIFFVGQGVETSFEAADSKGLELYWAYVE